MMTSVWLFIFSLPVWIMVTVTIVVGIGFMITVVMIPAIWIAQIRPFLKEHDERTSFPFWSWAPLTDYATASNLAQRLGERPRFLDTFVLVLKAQIGLFVIWLVAIGLMNYCSNK